MKIKIAAVLFVLTAAFNAYSVKFNDLSDDALIMKVGTYPVTMLDLKLFMSGYNTVAVWDSQLVNQMMEKIATNLLYMNAAQDEKLAVNNIELDYYTKKFFSERSVNLADGKALQLYFDQNDPYASLDDFIIKSTMYLSKIKYLAYKGYLDESKAYSIYLSSKNKKLAQDLVRQLSEGKVDFFTAFNKYAENRKDYSPNGETVSLKSELAKKMKKEDVQRILKAGLFNPVFVTADKGYYIVMNIDYVVKEDQEVMQKVMDELIKKYGINKLVSFTNK